MQHCNYVSIKNYFLKCILNHFSCVWLFATLCTVVHQAPLSMGFSRQEYWSGLPFPPPGDLPIPGIEPVSYVTCIGKQVVVFFFNNQWCHLESPIVKVYNINMNVIDYTDSHFSLVPNIYMTFKLGYREYYYFRDNILAPICILIFFFW